MSSIMGQEAQQWMDNLFSPGGSLFFFFFLEWAMFSQGLHISNMQSSSWGPLKRPSSSMEWGRWKGLLIDKCQQKNQPVKIILAIDLIALTLCSLLTKDFYEIQTSSR